MRILTIYKWYELTLLGILIVASLALCYHMYHMVVLDARSRGMKHPRILGFIVAGGQNGTGLLIYLLGRQAFDSSMSDADQIQMKVWRTRAIVCLIISLLAAFAFIVGRILNH